MKGNIRNFFPGGNTSEGFYSYYQYILGQKEAERIICLKGGPGTGKSTFMKSIAEHFLNKGEDVDYFWCSSDPDSLDGILLKDRRIAFMDGTSPHIVDPVNPGAVDTILHLGEYWNGSTLKKYKDYIMQSGETIKMWFDIAYDNLKAASDLRDALTRIYSAASSDGEIYQMAAGIINKELSHKKISISEGKVRKYFATAITPMGHLSHMAAMIEDYKKIYYFSLPVGFDMKGVMRVISDNLIHRGFYVEQYYCPMDPGNKIEHILVPELEMAFMTLNEYHDMDVYDKGIHIDMREYIDWNYIEKYADIISHCETESAALIEQSILCLQKAKQEHDVLEGYYVPNMNFQKIGNLIDEWIAKIESAEL